MQEVKEVVVLEVNVDEVVVLVADEAAVSSCSLSSSGSRQIPLNSPGAGKLTGRGG